MVASSRIPWNYSSRRLVPNREWVAGGQRVRLRRGALRERPPAAYVAPSFRRQISILIVDLDHEGSLDPTRVGAKAAWLAMGRRAGLPVLPGFVVEAAHSRRHMAIGERALGARGSGGARLAILGEPVPGRDELIAAGSSLGASLVARSSTLLEGSGEWSGAFTSYRDLAPAELPRAVAGCWASAFSVAALERQRAASIEPGSTPMAVLVQPGLEPAAGGSAELADGRVVVHGVEGSPSPLLQGWVAGETARWDGGWVGDGLVELLGSNALERIRSVLEAAHRSIGATRCEWAWDGEVWILQLGESGPVQLTEAGNPIEVDPLLIWLARLALLAPGPLGEEMVLPWAIGGRLPEASRIAKPDLGAARDIRDELVSQVWASPRDQARRAARETIGELRGPDPSAALDRIRRLRAPDPPRAGRLLGHLDRIRDEMVVRGAVDEPRAAWFLTTEQVERVLGGGSVVARSRVGLGRWDPLITSVVLQAGEMHRGTPASRGFGAGLAASPHLAEPGSRPPPRSVIFSVHPTQDLAPLLWDASGVVTAAGSPAAHLFDAARALGIPAVCGIRLRASTNCIIAVDGHAGIAAMLPLEGEKHD